MRRYAFVPAAMLVCLLATLRGQDQRPPDTAPQPPRYVELKQIVSASTLKYELIEDPQVPAIDVPAGRVLPPGLAIAENGKSRSLTLPKPPSDDVQKAFGRCEAIFSRRDFKAAATCFQELRQREPAFTLALTNMGDALYQAKDFAAARECLLEAADENPVDYQIRWFLGDALWYTGARDEAIEQLTLAHLLNVNHPGLKAHLMQARDTIRRPWKAWTLRPRYSIARQADTVIVRYAHEWKGYALVKAVWKHEPGFATKFAGADYSKLVVCLPEERRALEAFVEESPAGSVIADAVTDFFSTELILYELLLPRAPSAMHMLAREQQQRLVAYLQRYH